MNESLVSILIVTFNAEHFIAQTLQSCLDQTYQPTEILILDNASTDQTVSVIKRFTDNRIQLHLSAQNTGPYQGLNWLLDRAKGTYIAIQDHDDLWRPEKISEQIRFMESHLDFSACGTATYYYYEQKNVASLSSKPPVTDFVDHTSLLFRTTMLRYDPTRALPDEHFEMVQLRRLGRIGCVQEPLTLHRIRQDKRNVSTGRTKGNLRGAREHLAYTHGRDLAAALMYLVAGVLPSPFLWWLRRHVTLRSAQWVNRDALKQHYEITIE